MAICQCKMCGGSLDIKEGEQIAYCEYCGTKQTLPRLNDEKINKLLEKANVLRMQGEFDKAFDVYDKIIDESETVDPELYWDKLICKYGIRYVEENGSRIPTVNRTQFDSIFDDYDYKECIKNATESQKQVYEEEANTIENIQNRILEISKQDTPYDIFISYKDTDTVTNAKTQDSEDCYELYHLLTDAGYKVFFSRKSLNQMVGSEYEPHIFAALQSAKVMILYGTKLEYIEAPWVKNEWSRYLALYKKDPTKKKLITCTIGIDPYTLPDDLKKLQAIDMGKTGSEITLMENVKAIIPLEKEEKKYGRSSGRDETSTIITKAKIHIGEGNYEEAKKKLDVAFDIDPANWEIYLCRLLIDYNLRSEDELRTLTSTFEDNFNYKRIMEFASEDVKERIAKYNDTINEQNRLKSDKEVYDNAESLLGDFLSNDKLNSAKKLYKKILNYKDSKEKAQLCIDKIKENIINTVEGGGDVSQCKQALNDVDFISEDMDTSNMKEVIEKCIVLETQRAIFKNPIASTDMMNKAITALNSIIDFSDASQLKRNLEEKKFAHEKAIFRAKRYSAISAIFAVCCGICILCVVFLSINFGMSGERTVTKDVGNGKEELTYYLLRGKKVTKDKYSKVKYKGNWVDIDADGYLLAKRWTNDSNGNYGYLDEKGQKIANCFREISGNKYYFNENGVIVYQQFVVNPENPLKKVYIGENGYVESNKIVEIGGKKYYLDSDGAMREKGWFKVGDDEGYTQEDGSLLVSQFVKNDAGSEVYVDENGIVAKKKWVQVNDKWYYARTNGELHEGGFDTIDGKVFCFNDDKTLVIDEYKTYENKTRYFTLNGMAIDGLFDVKGVTHYFDPNGDIKKGWVELKDPSGAKYYIYCKEDGALLKNQPLNEGPDTYYFNKDGVMLKGQAAGGLYLGQDGKAIKNQWLNDVYYQSSGYVMTNGVTPDGYYVGGDGHKLKNQWVNNTFWVDNNGKIATNQWVDNNQYYVGSDGVYLTNQTINGKYLGRNGKVQTKAVAGDFALVGYESESEKKTVGRRKNSNGEYEDVKCNFSFKVPRSVDVTVNTNAFDSEASRLYSAITSAYSQIKSKAYSAADDDWTSFAISDWKITSFGDSTINIAITCRVNKKTKTLKLKFNRSSQSGSLDSFSF